MQPAHVVQLRSAQRRSVQPVYRYYLLGRVLLGSVVTILCLLCPWQVVQAQSTRPLLPILGAALPHPVPHPQVVDGDHLYNDLLYPALPEAAQAADLADAGATQQAPGQGVATTVDAVGAGNTLYNAAHVCNDFNQADRWASSHGRPETVWRDYYAGWAPFAKDDGDFYHAANVTFAQEKSVGPGQHAGANQFAAKIASNQPYAAGFGSPRLPVPPGADVVVAVKYLLFDHDTGGLDFDWVSLGLKADATGPTARYINGYARGRWATLTQRIVAGRTGQIMVLLQAQSPAAVNSNIYFDDVQIAVNGQYLTACDY